VTIGHHLAVGLRRRRLGEEGLGDVRLLAEVGVRKTNSNTYQYRLFIYNDTIIMTHRERDVGPLPAQPSRGRVRH
jgi:hypothetical protein